MKSISLRKQQQQQQQRNEIVIAKNDNEIYNNYLLFQNYMTNIYCEKKRRKVSNLTESLTRRFNNIKIVNGDFKVNNKVENY